MRIVLAILAFVCWVLPTYAHEVRPAHLKIVEYDVDMHDVSWRQPVRDGRKLNLKVRLPEACDTISGPDLRVEAVSTLETWRITCSLSSGEISVDGLKLTLTDVIIDISPLDGAKRTYILRPANSSIQLDIGPPPGWVTMVQAGFTHILGGLDHLLFLIGLILLLPRRALFIAVTIFTLAHSLTLVLAATDVIFVPSLFVEILIAASIVLMAIEAIRRIQGHSGLTAQYYPLVIFLIGLIHGLGFAGELRGLDIIGWDLIGKTFAFNIGIEIGQLVFIAVALIATHLIYWLLSTKRKWVDKIASYSVGIVGCIWLAERLITL